MMASASLRRTCQKVAEYNLKPKYLMIIYLTALFILLPTLSMAASFEPSGQTMDNFLDVTVLDDGTLVVAGQGGPPTLFEAVRYSLATDGTSITDYLGWFKASTTSVQSQAYGLSRDGSYVVGSAPTDPYNYYRGFIWSENTGLVKLDPMVGVPNGDPDPASDTSTSAQAVSNDGAVVVGSGSVPSGTAGGALRWDIDWSDPNNPSVSSPTNLGVLAGAPSTGVSSATDVSGSGDVIVGSSRYTSVAPTRRSQAFRWVADSPGSTTGTMQGLGFLPGHDNSSAAAVSHDGNFVVGNSQLYGGSYDNQAFFWSASDNSMQGLGFVSGYTVSIGQDLSDDGSIVVGNSEYPIDSSFDSREAFYWTAGDGMKTLEAVLIEQGVDIGDWALTSADAISGDGTAIVGGGYSDGNIGTSSYDVFIARLDAATPTTTTTTSTTTTTTQPTTSTTTTTTQPTTSTTTTTLPPNGIIGVTDFTNSLGDIHKGRALGHKINTLLGRVVRNFASSSPGAVADYLQGKSIISPVFAYGEGSETIMAGFAAEHSYDTVAVKVALAGVDAEDDGRYNGNVELSGYCLGIAVDMYPGKMAKSSAMEPLNITIGYDHGFYEGDFDRSYLNGATPEISNGEPDVDTMSAYIKAGWRFALSEIASIRPYLELYYQKTEMDSYTETGGTFPGTVTSQDESNTKYSLGLEGELQVSDRFKVGADVLGIKLRDDQGPDLAVSVPNLGVFVYPGVKYDDTWAEFALNSQWNFTDDLWIFGEIRGTTGSDYPEDWSARVELSYAF